MPALTSPQGHGLAFTGFTLAVGTGGSPESFTPVANIEDFTLPVITVMVEDTNSSDIWVARQPVIQDMGKITMKIFWQPKDSSHHNQANSAGTASGLRYLMIQKTKTDFQAQYPDGTIDFWTGYVTAFQITGKVKDKFHATVEFTNAGGDATTGPQLV